MAVPKRPVKPIPRRGVNRSFPGDSIGPEYASNALNVRFKFGEVRPAPGRGLYSGPQGGGMAQAFGRFGTSGVITWPFYLTETKLFRRGNTSPFSPNAWFEVTGTLTPTGTRRWSWAAGEDHLFFNRGEDEILQWDGNPANQFDKVENVAGFEPIDGVAGVSPAARFLSYFADRVVVANTVENSVEWPNRLRWAQSGDFRKWNNTLGLGAGFLDIPMDQGEFINGMLALGDSLMIYSESSIVEVQRTGLVDPALVYRTRVRGVGLGGPYTLANVNQAQFFLGHDFNVWAWDGSQYHHVGDPVWKELKALAHYDALENYFGFASHTDYWLVLADPERGTYEAFVLDTMTGAWSRDTFPALTAAAHMHILVDAPTWEEMSGSWSGQLQSWEELGGTEPATILGGRTDGSTMIIDDAYGFDYFALGSIMDCFIETEDHYCADDGPWMLQAVIRVILIYDPKAVGGGPFEVGVSFDQGSTWTTQLVTPSPVGYSYVDFNKTGQLVRYRFREVDANVQFRWRSYGYQYTTAGDAPVGPTA